MHVTGIASFSIRSTRLRYAYETTRAGIPTTHAKALESLMTLQFQTFEDVSLLAG